MRSLVTRTLWMSLRRFIAAGIFVVFSVTTVVPSYAQSVLSLPTPGVRVSLSPEFNPLVLKAVKVHLDNPFKFDFIVDAGDSGLQGESLKIESQKLIRYFLASLTTPENDLWVNLSPYEKDKIIPESFGVTEMGRDLLAQDYVLKQITASLIYPEEQLGKKFWDKIYAEAQAKYGTTDIPVNTFNKVWIVPEKAVVFEKDNTVFVEESHLKVMLEEDYLALSKSEIVDHSVETNDSKDVNQLGSQIVREIVLPELEKEVNEGKNFAQLRQVYSSLILATWYKQKIKDNILNKVYSDQNKVAGVDLEDDQVKMKIYNQYLEAFKKGVYNYIKEDYDLSTKETVPRKYFSGGVKLKMKTAMGAPVITVDRAGDVAMLSFTHAYQISADIQPVRNLNRFIRVFRNLFKDEDIQNKSDDQKMVTLIGVLKSQGIAQERPEPLVDQDGNEVFVNGQAATIKVITIRKEGEAQRFYDAFVNRQVGGIQAINFKDSVTGQWYVVGFEGDVDQKLQHEKDEIALRMQGEHWIQAHNKVEQVKPKSEDRQLIDEIRALEFEAGQQNIFGTGIDPVVASSKLKGFFRRSFRKLYDNRKKIFLAGAAALGLSAGTATWIWNRMDYFSYDYKRIGYEDKTQKQASNVFEGKNASAYLSAIKTVKERIAFVQEGRFSENESIQIIKNFRAQRGFFRELNLTSDEVDAVREQIMAFFSANYAQSKLSTTLLAEVYGLMDSLLNDLMITLQPPFLKRAEIWKQLGDYLYSPLPDESINPEDPGLEPNQAIRLTLEIEFRYGIIMKMAMGGETRGATDFKARTEKFKKMTQAYHRFLMIYGSPQKAIDDLKAIEVLENEDTHRVPVNLAETMAEIQRLPKDIRAFIKESAARHQIPEHVLVYSLLTSRLFERNYPVSLGLKLLRKRGVITEKQEIELRKITPDKVKEMKLDPKLNSFLGAMAGGKTTVGMTQMRPVWVRRFAAQAWKELFNVDVTEMSDQKISWLLLKPEYHIEAVAAIWRGSTDWVKEARRRALEKGLAMDMTSFDKEASSERNHLMDDPKVVRLIPAPELFGKNDWVLTAYHPQSEWFVGHGAGALLDGTPTMEIQANLDVLRLNKIVVMSGALDDKPIEFTVDTEEDLNQVKELLKSDNPVLRKAAQRTLEKLRERGKLGPGAGVMFFDIDFGFLKEQKLFENVVAIYEGVWGEEFDSNDLEDQSEAWASVNKIIENNATFNSIRETEIRKINKVVLLRKGFDAWDRFQKSKNSGELDQAKQFFLELKTLDPNDEVVSETLNLIDSARDQVSPNHQQAGSKDKQSEVNNPGGIDFNPNKIDLKIMNNGQEIKFNFDPKQFENLQIDGFLPVITNITPLSSLSLFLGSDDRADSSSQLSMAK